MLKHGFTDSFSGSRLALAFRCAGYACLLMAFCGGPAPPSVRAADESEQKGDAAAKQVEEKSNYSEYLRSAGEHHRKRLHLAMQLRQEEIHRAVKLTDQQSRKVGIAAKGAVDRVIDRWLEQLLANNDLEIQFGQMQAEQAKASLIGMGANIDVEQVTQEEIWKNGVNQQFSAAQREFYKKMVAERRAFARGVSIGRLVLQLDQLLRFSNDQRQAMTKLLDGALAKDFAFGDSSNAEVLFARAIMNQGRAAAPVDPFAPPDARNAGNPLVKISDEKAGEILSKAQLERWSALRKNPNALFSGQGQGMPWVEGFGGNIIIDGDGIIELNGRVLVE